MEVKETEGAEKPALSVIVPVYNAIDCVERLAASVLGQRFRDLELILVDDGSADGTSALLDRIGETDPRVSVIHQENRGSSAARNTGIAAARGELLGFADADDELLPEMYALLMGAYQREKRKDVVYQIGRQEIAADGNRLADICVPPEKEEFIPSAVFFRELLLHRGDCSFCTKLIPRELLGENRFPEGELNEDFSLFLQLLSEMKGIYALPDYGYLVHYREESNSRTKDREAFPQVFTDIVVNADKALELAKERYPELKKEAVRFGAFQRLDYLLHIPISRMTRENSFYRGVVGWVRRHLFGILFSPYLTGKNRLYLLLLGTAPKTVRKAHRRKMEAAAVLRS